MLKDAAKYCQLLKFETVGIPAQTFGHNTSSRRLIKEIFHCQKDNLWSFNFFVDSTKIQAVDDVQI